MEGIKQFFGASLVFFCDIFNTLMNSGLIKHFEVFQYNHINSQNRLSVWFEHRMSPLEVMRIAMDRYYFISSACYEGILNNGFLCSCYD